MCYHYMDRIRPVNHAIMIVIVLITFVIVGCKDERSKVAVGDTDASSQNPCAPPLIQAILDDDKQAVQKLITNEGNLNEALPWVMSPLATAATWGRTEIATILLQHRANPSQRDPKFAKFLPTSSCIQTWTCRDCTTPDRAWSRCERVYFRWDDAAYVWYIFRETRDCTYIIEGWC